MHPKSEYNKHSSMWMSNFQKIWEIKTLYTSKIAEEENSFRFYKDEY